MNWSWIVGKEKDHQDKKARLFNQSCTKVKGHHKEKLRLLTTYLGFWASTKQSQ